MADSGKTEGETSQPGGLAPTGGGDAGSAQGAWVPEPGFTREGLQPDPFEDDDDPFGDHDDPFAEDAPFGEDAAEAQTLSDDAYSAETAHEDELDLGDDDMRLPWLEGDDEDYEDERGGLGQTTLLIILALVALALVVGTIVWALHHSDGKDLVADGGVIEAPAEPYKTRPDDPGGNEVAGTGDTSFDVAAGKKQSPQVAEVKPDPVSPGFSSIGAGAKAEEKAKPEAASESVSGVGVQVAAYTSKAAAERGWTTLGREYPDLAGMKHRIVKGQADIGTVYRLQAVPGDLAAAKALCSGMRKAGMSCSVKD